jgi:3-oxoacyl-[acyl-carrier protein] reductase
VTTTVAHGGKEPAFGIAGKRKMAALLNKTALVTGASRGIGRATASALAAAGAHVLVHYGRSAQDAESLVADIRSKEGRADAIQADLGTPNGATLLAKEVRSIVGERLDVLVSNAGISKAATIQDYTVEEFDNLFATNVRSPFFLVQQLLPVLGEGSNIIVISSIGAHAVIGKPGLDNPSVLAYASTKGALETLVKNWAAILGPRGVRVNAVAPGAIDTDMSNFTKTEAGREMTHRCLLPFNLHRARVRRNHKRLPSSRLNRTRAELHAHLHCSAKTRVRLSTNAIRK